MNRWEKIADLFDGINGVSLTAATRNDEVKDWQGFGPDWKQFLDIADEACSLLGGDDRYVWFNHLWETYRNRFAGQHFDGVEQPSGERVTFANLTLENAGRLSGRAARDLSESTDTPSVEMNGQTNGQTDTEEKKEKKHEMNSHAWDCAKEFLDFKTDDNHLTLKEHVESYAVTHEIKPSTLYKRLTTNRNKWDK